VAPKNRLRFDIAVALAIALAKTVVIPARPDFQQHHRRSSSAQTTGRLT
jgi:hypothetical protein